MNVTELESRALRTISEHQMLKNGDTVIVALSGGGDSMALFHFLFLHAERLGIRLRAAHVNHGIRGASADLDEAFVRAECARRGVPLDVHTLKLGPAASEDAARRARYAFFDGLCRRRGALLATAHTRSDCAETVLLALARGASLQGASGIPYVRGCVVRPLLDVPREAVAEYLAANGLEFRTDETNEGDAYARNRVRRSAMPALLSVNAQAEKHIAVFSRDAFEASAYIDAQAEELLRRAQRRHPCEVLDTYEADVLAAAPGVVLRAALHRLIAPHTEPSRAKLDRCERHVREGGAVSLNGGARFCVRQRLARIEIETEPKTWEFPAAEGVYPLPDGRSVRVERISAEKYEKMGKEAQNPLFSCVDYDTIKAGTLLRTRRQGDKFAPCGYGAARPLKKLLNEQRLSDAARASVVLCARGSEVLWASGFGCSEAAKPGAGDIAVITIQKRGTQ